MTVRRGIMHAGLRRAAPLWIVALMASSVWAVTAAAAPSRWAEVVLGRADGDTAASWAGDSVLWGYSTDDDCGVMVWDSRSRRARQLESETFPEVVAGDSFWYQGRAFWLRRGRNEIVSASPMGGGPVRVLLRQDVSDMTQLRYGGGRIFWMEESSATKKWSLQSMRLPKGRVERVAAIGSYWPDLVVSERMVAWIEVGENRFSPERHLIHVVELTTSGGLGQSTRVRPSADQSSEYRPGSLAISGDHLVWSVSEMAESEGVHTWRADEATRTHVAAPSPLDSEDPDAPGMSAPERPAIGGGLIAWRDQPYERESIVAWRTSDATATRIASPNDAELSDPVVSGGRVIWAEVPPDADAEEPTRSPRAVTAGTVVIWDSATGEMERVEAPSLDAAYGADLRVDGNRITYVGSGPGGVDDFLYVLERSDDVSQAGTAAALPQRRRVIRQY